MSSDFEIEICVDYIGKDGYSHDVGWLNLPMTDAELKQYLSKEYPDFDGEYEITDLNMYGFYESDLFKMATLDSLNKLFHFINDNYWENGQDVFEYAYLNYGGNSIESIIEDAEAIMRTGFTFYDYDEIGGHDESDLAYYLAKDGAFSRDELFDFVDWDALGDYIGDDVTACEHGFMHVDE